MVLLKLSQMLVRKMLKGRTQREVAIMCGTTQPHLSAFLRKSTQQGLDLPNAIIESDEKIMAFFKAVINEG